MPAAIPRPRGRGLIEARQVPTGNGTTPEFHDRAVVASLKRDACGYGLDLRIQFHDRAVVASLKPEQLVQA